MKRFLIYMAKGLWLSIPTCGLSVLIAFGDMQPLVMLLLVPVIIGLPWNIPGVLAMAAAGLMHGLDETSQLIYFWLGGVWVFLSVTLNGAFLSSLFKRKPWKNEGT